MFFTFIFLLSGCDYSQKTNHNGLFYKFFVAPMDKTLHFFSTHLNDNYGLAIIIVVLIIRCIFLPFMLYNYKVSYFYKEKYNSIKPKISKIQQKIDSSDSIREIIDYKKEKKAILKQNGVKQRKTFYSILPVLIQIPIVIGLFFAIKYPYYSNTYDYSHFLWFDLTQSDFIVALIAGFTSFLQALVSLLAMSRKERQSKYFTLIISPAIIIWWSLSLPSGIGLYWTINSTFIALQIFFAYYYYSKLAIKKFGNSNDY